VDLIAEEAGAGNKAEEKILGSLKFRELFLQIYKIMKVFCQVLSTF
jgi:hypothetical protein